MPRHTGGAVPLRFLIKTAITASIFKWLSPTRHTLTAVEPPRDRLRVARLHFPDCTAVVLRRHGGDGGVFAVLVRCHGGHGGAAATQLRIGRSHGGTVEILNMFKVSAVPPRRSRFWPFSAVLRRSMTEPLRNHGDNGSVTAVYVVQAPRWHRAFGVTGVVLRRQWCVRVWWDKWETRRIDPHELVPTTCLHSRHQHNRPQSFAVTCNCWVILKRYNVFLPQNVFFIWLRYFNQPNTTSTNFYRHEIICT